MVPGQNTLSYRPAFIQMSGYVSQAQHILIIPLHVSEH